MANYSSVKRFDLGALTTFWHNVSCFSGGYKKFLRHKESLKSMYQYKLLPNEDFFTDFQIRLLIGEIGMLPWL